MIRGFIAALVLLTVNSTSLQAAPVVELNPDQLRSAVSSRSVINPRRVYTAVETQMNSKPVDIRAFKADSVYYRVLVKNSNGKVSSIVIDAVSGALISGRSSIARKINATASQMSVAMQGSSTGFEESQNTPSGSTGDAGGSGDTGGGGDDDQGDDDQGGDDQGDDDQGDDDQGDDDQGDDEQ
ncbi:MAG: hypothetical protein ACR2O1_08060 [Boseongicola sp.]